MDGDRLGVFKNNISDLGLCNCSMYNITICHSQDPNRFYQPGSRWTRKQQQLRTDSTLLKTSPSKVLLPGVFCRHTQDGFTA